MSNRPVLGFGNTACIRCYGVGLKMYEIAPNYLVSSDEDCPSCKGTGKTLPLSEEEEVFSD